MSTLPITRLTVATAGLDVLPATRLKVACSLLMADMMEVGLVAWGTRGVDVLVVDAASPEGIQAMASAHQQRVPLLALTRCQSSVQNSAAVLSPAASVLDIANALKRLIGGAPKDMVASGVSPLLAQLRLDRVPGEPVLMWLGLLRIVLEPRRRTMHLLQTAPLQDLLDRVNSPHWQSSPLSEREWERRYRAEVVASHGIESLWWRLATMPDCMLPVSGHDTLQLAAWPDLDPQVADPRWSLVLACLMQRSWEADALAKATNTDIFTVQRLMYVIRASRLAGAGNQRRLNGVRASGPAASSRSFFKVAKHFGLKLLGLQHG